MCVIAICQDRKLTLDETQAMHAANPDGIGLAWINPRDGLVEYVKGLGPIEAQAFIDRLPLPQVVHFRWASVGGTVATLGHPFPMEEAPPLGLVGAAKSVFFHNGTWASWQKGLAALRAAGEYVDPTEPWSDTRVMAALATRHSPQAVADLVGDTQRLTVLYGDGRIWTAGRFIEHEGLRVSNLFWRPLLRVPLAPFSWDDEIEDADQDADYDEGEAAAVAAIEARAREALAARPKAKLSKKAVKRAAKKLAKKAAPVTADFFKVVATSVGHKYFPRVPRPLRPARGK